MVVGDRASGILDFRMRISDLQRDRADCAGDGKMVQCANLQEKGVHIDTCSICCGQWLDGGELEKLKKKGLLKSVARLFKSPL